MPDDLTNLVQQIHASGQRLVVAATGGGSLAVSRLLTVPGASRSVLEAIVPYAASSLAQFLGGRPDQFCSAPTARAMAMAAYRRAITLADGPDGLMGIGCTASLASDRPKHGPHRLHVAAQTREATRQVSLTLEKGRRTRDEEERLAADVVLNLIAECCGVSQRIELSLSAGEQLERLAIEAPTDWQALLAGEIESLRVHPASGSDPLPKILFSGAFHPLHDGHRQMAAIASQLLGAAVEFEIPIVNADKPALDYLEIDSRAGQFAADQPLWLTRAPTFLEKSRLFPGVTFIVGADTMQRIAQARFYGDDPAMLTQAIEVLASRGCRFLVFGRSAEERFQALADLELPPALAGLCREVSAAHFRVDLSSSELRAASTEP